MRPQPTLSAKLAWRFEEFAEKRPRTAKIAKQLATAVFTTYAVRRLYLHTHVTDPDISWIGHNIYNVVPLVFLSGMIYGHDQFLQPTSEDIPLTNTITVQKKEKSSHLPFCFDTIKDYIPWVTTGINPATPLLFKKKKCVNYSTEFEIPVEKYKPITFHCKGKGKTLEKLNFDVVTSGTLSFKPYSSGTYKEQLIQRCEHIYQEAQ